MKQGRNSCNIHHHWRWLAHVLGNALTSQKGTWVMQRLHHKSPLVALRWSWSSSLTSDGKSVRRVRVLQDQNPKSGCPGNSAIKVCGATSNNNKTQLQRNPAGRLWMQTRAFWLRWKCLRFDCSFRIR